MKDRYATIAGCVFSGLFGMLVQGVADHHAITQARASEAQANGLEDQCKATLNQRISKENVILDAQGNAWSCMNSGQIWKVKK